MQERKYFLDWLRVIAFGLLILFHLGLLYVSWHYNLKSPRIFPGLEFAMVALNPWRLALLFFISGVACRHLLAKKSPREFVKDRLRRLGIVILFGMLVVIPPQTYVELYSRGLVTSSYIEFWLTSYLAGDPYPGKVLPTWDHLWFLVYLLVYCLVLAGLFRILGSTRQNHRLSLGFLLFAPGLWLCVSNVLVAEFKPPTFSLMDDWAAHIRWSGIFAAGVLCALRADFWASTVNHRSTFAKVAVLFLFLEWCCRIYWLSGGMDAFSYRITYSVLSGVFGWSTLLTLFGLSATYLNRPSKLLTYLTDAVLPVYVLHQPLLLIAAYYMFPLNLPVLVEAAAITICAGPIAILIYEFAIRRRHMTRVLFGLKTR